jgi:hypothetical protein
MHRLVYHALSPETPAPSHHTDAGPAVTPSETTQFIKLEATLAQSQTDKYGRDKAQVAEDMKILDELEPPMTSSAGSPVTRTGPDAHVVDSQTEAGDSTYSGPPDHHHNSIDRGSGSAKNQRMSDYTAASESSPYQCWAGSQTMLDLLMPDRYVHSCCL